MKSLSQKIFIFRLLPKQDLKKTLLQFAKENKLLAGYIITCVGSLEQAHIRTADAQEGSLWREKMEIASLVGTLSESGAHLHISLADSKGNMIGGHLLEGCLIYTTAEIVVGNALDLIFTREEDPLTKCKELSISKKR